MISAEYLDHYVKMIQMLGIWLEADDIEKVLKEDERVAPLVAAKFGVGYKLKGSEFTMARDRWHSEHIKELHKRTRIDKDTIHFILFYESISDELVGPFGHPRRKHRKPGKGMTKEKCREWFARRIDDITGFDYEKILSVLMTRDDVYIDVLVNYGYIPLLSDDFQKVVEADMQKELVDTIVSKTEANKTEVEIILHFEDLLKKLCGAPQRP